MVSLSSTVTRKLLGQILFSPEREFYIQELCKLLDLDKRNMVKKLHELAAEGLLIHRRQGNLKLYKLNPAYPLLNEYKNIFLKTAELNGGHDGQN
jgi:DNA-binding transcriptional ArsR family regulator